MKYKESLLILILSLVSIALFSQTRIIMKKEGGVYTIPCKVNGLNLKFIFDTGAGDVSISMIEASFMLKNGYLSRDDIKGTQQYLDANGNISEGRKIILKEIEIAGLKLFNVEASIVNNLKAPLLFGQSAISKLGKISLSGNELVILSNRVNENNLDEIKKTLSAEDIQNIKIEYDKGKTALDLGKYQQSISSFKYVIENSNDNDIIASSYGNLGIAYVKIGNSLESITMWDQACKMNNGQYCYLAAFNKGELFFIEGNFERAIEEFKECISLEPNGINNGKTKKILTGYKNLNFRSHYRIGFIYASKYKDYNSALIHLKESIEPYDEESLGVADWKLDALNNIGYCYYELRDDRKCIEYAQKILEINKYDKNALMSICYSFDNLGDSIQAKKYCKMAIDLGDERAKAFLKKH